MNNPSESNPPPAPEHRARKIAVKIFGVGGAGVSVLEKVARRQLPGVTLIALNSDPDSLTGSSAAEKIALELKQPRGLGRGGDPEWGRALAEHHLPRLKAACEGADVIFILAGLGGGVGTGVGPLLAHAAKETGALVLAFVTLPFDCEGSRRQRQSHQGLQELQATADGVICVPNQRLFRLIDESTSVRDTFTLSNELLADGVVNIWRLIACEGLIEIHVDDLRTVLRERHGESVLASVESAGPERSREAVEKLFTHPMLEEGRTLAESAVVLVSLLGGPGLTMTEIHYVMEHINSKCPKAQVIMGAAVDDAFGARLAVTLVASRRGESLLTRAGINETDHARAQASEDLGSRLVNRLDTPRPQSRFVPPPPALPPEKMEQMLEPKSPTPARQRKKAARMHQAQLPLEIVSKGRFDKSEPTIHKGEDLDVPTYIRRGVALN